MKLSIITINYNNIDGLQKTIDSVITQTYEDFEWIIIDGGSTDGSKELIKQYSKYITYWVSEPDKGIYNALNKGITKSAGEYLNFMNSGDTFYNRNTIENVFTIINTENIDADIIYGNTIIDDKKLIKEGKPASNITLSYLFKSPINHQSMFIKRKTQTQFMYDEKYKLAADRKFLLMASLSGATFHYVDIFIASYDYTGISSYNTPLVQKEHKEIIEEIVPNTIKQDIYKLLEIQEIHKSNPILSTIYKLLQKRWIYIALFSFCCGIINFIDKIIPTSKKL